MTTGTCGECGHAFRATDLAPLKRRPDGTCERACRRCVGAYIRAGYLYERDPFWRRQEAGCGPEAPA